MHTLYVLTYSYFEMYTTLIQFNLPPHILESVYLQFRMWSFWNDKLHVLGELVRYVISLLCACSWNKRSYCLISLSQIRFWNPPAMIRSIAFVLVVLVIGNLGFSINGKNKMLMLPKLLLNIYSRIFTLSLNLGFVEV